MQHTELTTFITCEDAKTLFQKIVRGEAVLTGDDGDDRLRLVEHHLSTCDQCVVFCDDAIEQLATQQPLSLSVMQNNRDEPIPCSPHEFLILQLLGSHERYGLELVKKSESRLKRGTIYVTLEQMQANGLVESRYDQEERSRSGTPRRLYKATAFGTRVYAAWFNSRSEDAAGAARVNPELATS